MTKLAQSLVIALMLCGGSAWAQQADAPWSADAVWHDGQVEKAVYRASRVIYGKPRAYEAIFFTNKEQHDRRTLTKASKSQDVVEVWKFNQVEVIPTPNYHYKYLTTAHLSVDVLALTRLECSSQEFCGTSFKQYLLKGAIGSAGAVLEYFGFSYMPEAGRVIAKTRADVVPADALPLWLRSFDFQSRGKMAITLLPSQKSNHATPYEPLPAEVRYAGEEPDAHRLELHVAGKVLCEYWMSRDPKRLNIMTRYRGADRQEYELISVERTDYWTIQE